MVTHIIVTQNLAIILNLIPLIGSISNLSGWENKIIQQVKLDNTSTDAQLSGKILWSDKNLQYSWLFLIYIYMNDRSNVRYLKVSENHGCGFINF